MNRSIFRLFPGLLLACAILIPVAPGRAQTPTKQQKPPAQVQQQQEQEEYTEEEYDAYEKATQEADLDKRATMLFAFIEKYPKSKLLPYITTATQTLMYEHKQAQRWDKLQPLAERWEKLHPTDLQTWAYIVESAQKLGQDQKFLEYAQRIYGQKPSANLALYIYQTYRKLNDQPKYFEWAEKMFAYPEFNGEYELRMLFVQKHMDEKSFEKAAHYADLALKSLDAAKKPDAMSAGEWTKKRMALAKSCNYIIGVNHYDKQKYAEAIRALETALKSEKFDFAYYYIGRSLWSMDKVEEAIDSFAKAVVLEGEAQGQAREHLEKLYKAMHNNTTIGIEKVYRKAKTELGVSP